MYNCLKWPFRDLQILATLLLFCFFTPKVAAYCLMLKHQQEKKHMMMNNDVISRVALSHAVSHVKHKCPSYVHIQVLKSLGYARDWYRLE